MCEQILSLFFWVCVSICSGPVCWKVCVFLQGNFTHPYQTSIVSVDYIGDPECMATCFSPAIFNALPSLWAINSSQCAPLRVSEFNLHSVHWESQVYFHTFPKVRNIFRHNPFKSSFCIFCLCFVIFQQELSKIQRQRQQVRFVKERVDS